MVKDKQQSSSDNPYDAYNAANGGDNLRKFSDELLEKFKGKIIQLYIGDQCETLNFEDFSVPQNCCICGKLIDVLDRFIILDCYFFDPKSKQLKTGNHAYINTFQIRAMTEINGIGSLSDIFLHVNDAKLVRKLILEGMKK
jgi:hypothetical protein